MQIDFIEMMLRNFNLILIILSLIIPSCVDNFEDIEFERINKDQVQITFCFKEYAIMNKGCLVAQGIGKGKDILNISDSLTNLTLVVRYGQNCEVVVYKLKE